MGYLRFLLACLVVLGHSGAIYVSTATIGALAAVEAFFFISGFCIAATFSQNYTGPKRHFRFFLSRFARLYPQYLAILIIMVFVWKAAPVFGWTLNNSFDYFAQTHNSMLDLAVWSQLFQDVLSVDLNLHMALPLRQTWSISAELVFYAATPMLIRLRFWLMPLTAALFIFKCAAFYWFGFRYSYFPFLSQGCYYTLGIVVFLYRERLFLTKGIAGFAVLFVATLITILPHADFETGRLWAHLTLMAALVVATPTILMSREGATSRAMGNLSYGIYIAHFPVIDVAMAALRPSSLEGLAGYSFAALVLVCTTSLAACLESVIQRPLDAWRKNNLHDRHSEWNSFQQERTLGTPT